MIDDWDDRLGWAFDLVSDAPERRGRARQRLLESRERWSAALRSYNEVWNERDHPEFQARQHAFSRAHDFTFPHALWRRGTEPMSRWAGLPYAVLYLRWEATYPDEWTPFRTSWGSKRNILRDLVRVADELRPPVVHQLEDLVMLAVRRHYRCEDAGYARLARSIDSPRLRDRLTAAARSTDEPRRTHAAYLLWLIENPSLPHPKIPQWKTWLLHRALTAGSDDVVDRSLSWTS
jgi:hypothetical protein